MEKRDGMFLGILIGVIILASFVSAQSSPVDALKDLFQGTKEVLTSLGEVLLGPGPEGIEGSGLFARALIFLIVLSIVWSIVSDFGVLKSNTWFIAIISLSVSLLSTRFLLQPEWIQTILLPYSALSVALTAFLPLMIYAYFIYSINIKYSFLRRFAWALAAVVFIGLWYSRSDEIISSTAIFVYPIAAGICGIFFIFDQKIANLRKRLGIKKEISLSSYLQVSNLERQWERMNEEWLTALSKGRTKQAADLKKKLDQLDNAIRAGLGQQKE